ncbi:hypothetical protein N7527_008671 [Penicillium freii]|nr:hypothetical protein N7527_008671 [Penicillium freii]
MKLFYQNRTGDQRIQINYSPTFFESYRTLGEIKFLHGLYFHRSQLHLFKLGNEFNFAPGKYRAANYLLLDYVEEWNSKLTIFKSAIQKAYPSSFPGFMAPSLVLLDFIDDTTWTAEDLYNLGYDKDGCDESAGFQPDHVRSPLQGIQIPRHKSAQIERLIGPGSDALDNITFSISYDHALNWGEADPTAYEETRINNGLLTIVVPDCSAVLLNL